MNKKNKDNLKFDEKEINKNIQNIEKVIKTKKELPEKEANSIYKKVFKELLLANFIVAFLFIISLEALNVESAIFITKLKTLSILLAICTILLFEYSYRKENGKIFLHGLECFCVAVFTLSSTYLYVIYFRKFQFIVSIATIVVLIYFMLKSLYIYIKMRKKYFAGINDINEIIKK